MTRFTDLTLNGTTNGIIYAAVALGLVMIWRATRVVNFAAGAMAMFTTYVATTLLDRDVSYWVAFAVALATGLVMGAVTERVLVRPVENKPPVNAVVVTLGLLIALEGMAGIIWGGNTRGFYFSITTKLERVFDFFGARRQRNDADSTNSAEATPAPAQH